MKRLLCAYRNASLRVKLSLLVTAVLLTVLIACQVALYFYVAENVERQARSAADVTLTQAQTYMDAKLRNVVERLFYIRLDPSFEGALTDYLLSDKPSAQGVAMTLLSPCLSLHKVTEPLISSIFLYTPKSSFTDMGVSTEQEYRFEASVLWRQAEESESYVIWGEVQKDEIFITHREVLPVMYRFSVDGYGGDCVLLANIDKARLTAYLHDIVPDDGSDMLLVDGRGRLVTQAGGAAAAALAEDYGALHAVLETEGFTETAAQGGKYLTAHRALANAPWHVVYLQSEKHILGQLQNIRNVFFAVSLAVVLVLLVALTRIVHSVTQPLSRLSQRMRSVDVKND
ncbi:cache domain-containing protein [Ruthenibacterium lactatiformans]